MQMRTSNKQPTLIAFTPVYFKCMIRLGLTHNIKRVTSPEQHRPKVLVNIVAQSCILLWLLHAQLSLEFGFVDLVKGALTDNQPEFSMWNIPLHFRKCLHTIQSQTSKQSIFSFFPFCPTDLCPLSITLHHNTPTRTYYFSRQNGPPKRPLA